MTLYIVTDITNTTRKYAHGLCRGRAVAVRLGVPTHVKDYELELLSFARVKLVDSDVFKPMFTVEKVD